MASLHVIIAAVTEACSAEESDIVVIGHNEFMYDYAGVLQAGETVTRLCSSPELSGDLGRVGLITVRPTGRPATKGNCHSVKKDTDAWIKDQEAHDRRIHEINNADYPGKLWYLARNSFFGAADVFWRRKDGKKIPDVIDRQLPDKPERIILIDEMFAQN